MLRIWNREWFKTTPAALETIWNALNAQEAPSSAPAGHPSREREQERIQSFVQILVLRFRSSTIDMVRERAS